LQDAMFKKRSYNHSLQDAKNLLSESFHFQIFSNRERERQEASIGRSNGWV
jgi:hypothetical protein